MMRMMQEPDSETTFHPSGCQPEFPISPLRFAQNHTPAAPSVRELRRLHITSFGWHRGSFWSFRSPPIYHAQASPAMGSPDAYPIPAQSRPSCGPQSVAADAENGCPP